MIDVNQNSYKVRKLVFLLEWLDFGRSWYGR